MNNQIPIFKKPLLHSELSDTRVFMDHTFKNPCSKCLYYLAGQTIQSVRLETGHSTTRACPCLVTSVQRVLYSRIIFTCLLRPAHAADVSSVVYARLSHPRPYGSVSTLRTNVRYSSGTTYIDAAAMVLGRRTGASAFQARRGKLLIFVYLQSWWCPVLAWRMQRRPLARLGRPAFGRQWP